jgi:site-specific DNA-methyltransferase (adenine-specific)
MAILKDALFSSATDEWETPQDVFDALDKEFHFTLDPCSTDDNAKCRKHYTKQEDGLAQDWTGETVFCNPPYGKEAPAWMRKCLEHSYGGGTAVMLIPARTDTKAFHEYIYGKAEIRFVKGRLKFGQAKYNAPFPSMIVVFKGKSCATQGTEQRLKQLSMFDEGVE